MLVSWDWLKQYVDLDMTPAELEHRLSMSGLNHESTEKVGEDLAIDLEVTSNRPDWLGHLGIAREVAVLWDRPLRRPDPQPSTSSTAAADAARVSIECPDLCPRYTARLIRGIEVKASPAWLVQRLSAIGLATVNNVVDITNFVMMECGQPLHAFDLSRLRGGEIIVRRARPQEKFAAINHREYELDSEMCVIADAQRAVALGGVMGGADTEVEEDTVDVLIESADFASLSIRTTARALNLHSPSSYRFERRVDPEGVDWASRRCCELILELAGGELLSGVLDAGEPRVARTPVTLRRSQLERILGIRIEPAEVDRILTALGCRAEQSDAAAVTVVPPSWRHDLTREIDLVEEVARIHGYEEIPEDVGVPMVPSHRTDADRVLAKVRHVLTAAGFDEALTCSVVERAWIDQFSPWTDEPPLQCNATVLRGASFVRQSLVPSLLEARRINQSVGNPVVELFETARVYLARPDQLPLEQPTVALTSGRGFALVKGTIEALVESLNPRLELEVADYQHPLLADGQACELSLDGERLGFIGQVSETGSAVFGLRSETTIAELDLQVLGARAELVPQYASLSAYPPISRDMNLIVAEAVRWADLSATVRTAAGPCLEQVTYQETYRDPNRDGSDKKRLLLSIDLRAPDRTLTNEEADSIRDTVEHACRRQHQAVLVR